MVRNPSKNQKAGWRLFRLQKPDVMLLRMIGHSKGQFLAVLTIIILGIATYTGMDMTSVNMNSTVNAYYQENGFPDLFLQTVAVPAREVKKLKGIDGVKEAMGRITADVPMITDNENERINLRLVTTKGDRDELSRSTLLEGKMMSADRNEAMLIEQFADARGIEPDDEISVQVGGVQRTLEVTGIVANPEYIYMMENAQTFIADDKHFGVCYVSEDFGREAARLFGSYNEILISYEEGVDEDSLIDDVEDVLDVYGIEQTVKKKDQLSNSMIDHELVELDSMSGSLPVVFLLAAGLILMMML